MKINNLTRKTFICIVTMFGLCINLLAQNLPFNTTLKSGEVLQRPKKYSLYYAFEVDSTGNYYTVSYQYGREGVMGYVLECVSPANNVLKSLDLAFKDKAFHYVTAIKNEIHLFYSVYDVTANRSILYREIVDKHTLQLNGNPKKMFEVDLSKGKISEGASYYFCTSLDASKILLGCQIPNEKKDLEMHALHMYNEDLVEQWNKDVTLPSANVYCNTISMNVSNAGTVNILSQNFKISNRTSAAYPQISWVDGKPNYVYTITQVVNKGAKTIDVDIQMEDYFMQNPCMRIDEKHNELICSGAYSAYSSKETSGGVFVVKINGTTNQISFKQKTAFSKETMMGSMTVGEQERAIRLLKKGHNYEAEDLNFTDISLKEDGGFYILFERYMLHIEGNEYYHYDDIFIVSCSASGDVEWVKFIPKKQHTKNDYGIYSSYSMTQKGDDLYFIFNDNILNMSYEAGQEVKLFAPKDIGAKAALVIVKVDSKGIQSKEIAVAYDEMSDFIMTPQDFELLSNNRVLLINKSNSTAQFLTLTFEKK